MKSGARGMGANGNLSPKDRERLWKQIRPKLKERFERAGQLVCEICGGTFGLSFAHRSKRRFITTKEELEVAALLCQLCHTDLDEKAGHEEMYKVVTELRDKKPV